MYFCVVSLVVSIPNFITYDTELLEYYDSYNATYQKLAVSLECVQKFNGFFNNLIQWYSALLSYFLPSLVLIFCHIKILLHLSKQTVKFEQMPVSVLYTTFFVKLLKQGYLFVNWNFCNKIKKDKHSKSHSQTKQNSHYENPVTDICICCSLDAGLLIYLFVLPVV